MILLFLNFLTPYLSFQNLPLGKNAKIGFSKAMSEGWLRIDKAAEGGPRIYRKVIAIFPFCFVR